MHTDLEIDRAIIENNLVAGAPERQDELKRFWAQYDPEFVIKADCAAIAFSAGRKRITTTHQTLTHDWLIAFASWKAFRAYGPIVLAALISNLPLNPGFLDADAGLPPEEDKLDELLYTARELARAHNVEDVPWPENVPTPQADGSNLNSEDHATFDLLCIATAASFLHEIRHVRFRQDKDAPAHGPNEETACDEAARQFLTERAADYARDTNQDLIWVICKRAMGLAIAAYIIHMQTPPDERGGTTTHPSSRKRFEELAAKVSAPEDSDFWIFFASLLISILRRDRKFTVTVPFRSPKELAEKLLGMIA
jgi:hypothetical protein